MATLRVFFADFWPNFSMENNFIVSALQDQYAIHIDSEHPDYVFFSAFGAKHFQYPDAVKIYFTGENDVPDFNLCDYGIAYAFIDFEDRYIRLPLYAISNGYDDWRSKVLSVNHSQLSPQDADRKFCNFVYSNAQKAHPLREQFFRLLSQYKPVDSGGRYLNNIGKPVADKLEFIRNYKFTIAFENSSSDGYTTEKLLDPMRAHSLPIYWGNPKVGLDFNTSSFINVHDFSSLEAVVDEIIFLDTHNEAYLDKLSQPCVKKGQWVDYKKELSEFLHHIVEQPLPTAKRAVRYGFNDYYTQRQRISSALYSNKIARPLLKKLIG